MKELTTSLLKKVKASISLRESNPEAYTESFRQAETFITATIQGQLEFVPIQLLFINNSKYQILMEVKAVFGDGENHDKLDDLLIKFYNEHNLKRDIESIADSVKYHIKPQRSNDKPESGILNWQKFSPLAKYAGKPYRATDKKLKTVGQDFAAHIMHPTNSWAESILLDNYTLEPERYWQVAGHFKSFTWAKIKHNKHTDKQIFFSVGVDIAAGKLVIKLDCLRSGTHKLSNYDIRKFDYYTDNLNCKSEVDMTLGEAVGWNFIEEMSSAFIKELEAAYLGVVEYVSSGKVDLEIFSDRLFNILPENAKFSAKKAGDPLPELLYNTVLDGIVRYEQYMLNHADKYDLASLVKYTFGEITQIESYEFDGQHKKIYVVANTGGPTTPFEISEELRHLLVNDDHVYIYQIYEYDEAINCGKMVMRKGDPKQYAKLESKLYLATLK